MTSKPVRRNSRASEPGREVGAVLVVDVPERDLAQDTHDVGQLEEDDDVAAVADRARGRAA